jgi:hypothetical protein
MSFADARSCQEAILKYTCTLCSVCLPQPLSSLDASAIDSLSPPAAELALSVQLICTAVHLRPPGDPLLPLVSLSNTQLDTCALASIGALFALCYAAAARHPSHSALSSQISSDLQTLAAALYTLPQQNFSNEARAAASISECVSELLRRSGHWAVILEQTLHMHAVGALCQLVAKVQHPHMSACTDAILPVICDICCHFDASHRGAGARALLHIMSHADKVVLRLHKDRVLKVCGALCECTAISYGRCLLFHCPHHDVRAASSHHSRIS